MAMITTRNRSQSRTESVVAEVWPTLRSTPSERRRWDRARATIDHFAMLDAAARSTSMIWSV